MRGILKNLRINLVRVRTDDLIKSVIDVYIAETGRKGVVSKKTLVDCLLRGF